MKSSQIELVNHVKPVEGLGCGVSYVPQCSSEI